MVNGQAILLGLYLFGLVLAALLPFSDSIPLPVSITIGSLFGSLLFHKLRNMENLVYYISFYGGLSPGFVPIVGIICIDIAGVLLKFDSNSPPYSSVKGLMLVMLFLYFFMWIGNFLWVEGRLRKSKSLVFAQAQVDSGISKKKASLIGISGILAAVVIVGLQLGDILPFSYYLGVLIASIAGRMVGFSIDLYRDNGKETQFRFYEPGIVIGKTDFGISPWQVFGGYRLTENHLIIVRKWGIDMHLVRDSIDDLEAATSVLDDYLVRLD